MSIEEIEARRAARRAEHDKAHAEQYAKDFEALDKLEEEHGYERVLSVTLKGWRSGEGAATMIVVRVPRAREAIFKRFQQQVNSNKAGAKQKVEAAELLGSSCLLYPSKTDDPECHEATMDLAPGVLGHAAALIVEAVQGEAEEEGK